MAQQLQHVLIATELSLTYVHNVRNGTHAIIEHTCEGKDGHMCTMSGMESMQCVCTPVNAKMGQSGRHLDRKLAM